MNLKQLFTVKFVETLTESLSDSVNRFPLAFLSVIVLTAVVLLSIHEIILPGDTLTIKLLLSSSYAFLFSISIALYQESRESGKDSKLAGQVLASLAVIIYGFFLPGFTQQPSFDFLVTHALIAVALLGAVFVAPYVRNFFQESDYSISFYAFCAEILFTVASSVVLGLLAFLLGAFTLVSLDTLFGLNIPGDWYGQWATATLLFFAPLFALSKAPRNFGNTPDNHDKAINRAVFFASNFIAIPFLMIYTLIVYVYGFRIVVSGVWPDATISWMIIWYAAIGYTLFIVTYPRRNKGLLKYFRKYWSYAVIPPVILLFYSLIIRIYSYGFTINRYLALLFGIWLLCMIAYFILSSRKRIAVIPATLVGIIVLVLVSPLNLYVVPKYSQLHELRQNLIQANILNEGTITPLEKDVDISDGTLRGIRSEIIYLCENHGCESMRSVLGPFYDTTVTDDEYSYNTQYQIIDALGLPENRYGPELNTSYNLYFNQNLWGSDLDVSDYKTMRRIDYGRYSGQESAGLMTEEVIQKLIDFAKENGESGNRPFVDSDNVEALYVESTAGSVRLYPESINILINEEGSEIEYASLIFLKK